MIDLRSDLVWAANSGVTPAPNKVEAFVRETVDGGDGQVIATLPSTEYSIEVSRKNAHEERATVFTEALKEGLKPAEAAKRIGTTLSRINTSDDMKAAIAKLMEVAAVSAEIKKAAVRAGLFQIFMQNMENDPDIALKAAKEISKDPELGLGGDAPALTVHIGGGIADMLKNLEPFPGVPPPQTIDIDPA